MLQALHASDCSNDNFGTAQAAPEGRPNIDLRGPTAYNRKGRLGYSNGPGACPAAIFSPTLEDRSCPRIPSRRQFLATASAGAAISLTATSYARVVGANERISIGLIGCGGRGYAAHMPGVHPHDKEQNVEFTAVSDPWRMRRERAAARCQEWYGRPARQFVSYRDILALKDVDAVMIASCDHHHAVHLEAAAKAKKDAYCEKPLAMDMESLKRCCDAVKASRHRGADGHAGPQLRHEHRLPRAVPLRRDRQGLADRAVPQRHQALLVLVDAERRSRSRRRTSTGRSSSWTGPCGPSTASC